MRHLNKLLTSFLSLAIVCVIVMTSSMTAFATETATESSSSVKEGYTYTVRLLAAGTEGQFADKDTIKEKLQITNDKTAEVVVSDDKKTVTISNLTYDAKITFTANAIAGTVDGSKYTVKGLKVSGADDVTAIINVTKDQDYVLAYSLGDLVEYTVYYQYADGTQALAPEVYYGPAGEKIAVAYRYIPNYLPNTYSYVGTLSSDGENTFTFTYTSGNQVYNGGTTYTYGSDDGSTSYVTTGGGTDYSYVNVPGNTTTTYVDGGNDGNAANAAGDNAGAAGGNAAGDNAATDDQTIADDQTPTDGPTDVIDIDDTETPLSAAVKDNLIPIIAGCIIAIAILAIVLALVVNNKRKKAVVVSKDNETKSE